MNITIESHERVATITINRPHVRNAVDGETAAELADAFRSFDADPNSTWRCSPAPKGRSVPEPTSRPYQTAAAIA
jgi:hypothetical protein